MSKKSMRLVEKRFLKKETESEILRHKIKRCPQTASDKMYLEKRCDSIMQIALCGVADETKTHVLTVCPKLV